jgi:predicted S18 family serine protease
MKTQECTATKKCSKCLEVKEISLFLAKGAVCKACSNIFQAEYRAKNKERISANLKAYRATPEGNEKKRVMDLKWRTENPERKKANDKAYVLNNREKVLQNKKDYYQNNIARFKEYAVRNRDKKTVYNREYANFRYNNDDEFRLYRNLLGNARKKYTKQATPSFINWNAVEAIYKTAQELTKETGEFHEVDHIIPLRGKKVSGLHWEANLRIVTRHINRVKSNNLVDDIV